MNSLAVLESEKSISNISQEDLEIRNQLINCFRHMPLEFLPRLRHLSPQTGCLNSCSFCSQNASPHTTQFTYRGLANLFSALKTVGLEIATRFINEDGSRYLNLEQQDLLSPDGIFSKKFKMPEYGLLGYARSNHRPGVVFSYLDNDNGYYELLDIYLKFALEDLGVKVRVSTVGFSRKNQTLQKVHENISHNLSKAVAGIRLSFTPYTLGITEKGEKSGLTSREDFIKDTTNFLKIYHPLIKKLGTGARTACIELRFKPFIKTDLEFKKQEIKSHNVLKVGNYLLISEKPNENSDYLTDFKVNKKNIHFLTPPQKYILVISELINKDWEKIAANLIDSQHTLNPEMFFINKIDLYRLKNEAGEYYSIDPNQKETGIFDKYIYPPDKERGRGYIINSERYFLNSIIKIKNKYQLNKRDQFLNATWNYVDEVLAELFSLVSFYKNIDKDTSNYIENEVIPLVISIVISLKQAGYPASYFFDKNFLIDTGTICNLGRATHEFKGLSLRNNAPLTSQHERVYGVKGALATEGVVWKIGLQSYIQNGLTIEELDLSNTSTVKGQKLFTSFIPLSSGTENINISSLKNKHLIPGQKKP